MVLKIRSQLLKRKKASQNNVTEFEKFKTIANSTEFEKLKASQNNVTEFEKFEDIDINLRFVPDPTKYKINLITIEDEKNAFAN